ncbi:MAG: ATP-binding protein, partial [Candidatus Binatia bacterium]
PTSAATERLARLSRSIPLDLADKVRASQGAVAGERKLVTVLFCDVVGSTSIAETMDPEEFRDLLDEYLDLAFREVYRLEGIVNQIAGDGFMALFGAPVAHEDDPRRALRAALAIRDTLANLADTIRGERGIEFRVRIGINTGPVVVGTVGSDLKTDYSAIGDTTNLAARLQSIAAPGTVIISDSTHRLVRGFFEVRTLGPLAIKGKAEPITAYEVLSESDVATPMTIAEARGMTPLIGRTEELAQLVACWSRIPGGLPQVAAVVGEAGSGKSRLIYEFRQRIAGEEMTIFEARCSSLSQALPYAPIIAMLRQWFGIVPGEAAPECCKRIGEKVVDIDPDLGTLYPLLCRLLSVSPDEMVDRSADDIKRETFEAVVHLAAKLSERAPVLMIIEDLHWIDDSSREMVELAVAKLQRARMMILFSHRPDYVPSWRLNAAFTHLSLRRLADPEAAEVAAAVAGGRLPTELERAIVVRAEGNPFYLEELTRTVVEEGYVVRGDREIRMTRPISEMRVPNTVHELLAARLDRVGANAKRVIQVASVLGRQFRRADVLRLLTNEIIDVDAELETLERRGVLHRKTVLSDDEYRFGESLTQEVAYEGMLLKERRALHDRVGHLIEHEDGDRTAERSALLA